MLIALEYQSYRCCFAYTEATICSWCWIGRIGSGEPSIGKPLGQGVATRGWRRRERSQRCPHPGGVSSTVRHGLEVQDGAARPRLPRTSWKGKLSDSFR